MRIGMEPGQLFVEGPCGLSAGTFHDSQLCHIYHSHSCRIPLYRCLQTAYELFLTGLLSHINKIDQNHSGQIAQTHLSGRLQGSFQIQAQDTLLFFPATRCLPGVDVDYDHGPR